MTHAPEAEPRPAASTRRIQFYSRVVAFLVALVVIILLVVENTRPVHVSWGFGSGNIRLVWLVLGVAICAYVLGLLTAIGARRSIHRSGPDTTR